MPRIPAVYECDWCGAREPEAASQGPPGWRSPYTGDYGYTICPGCVVLARAAIEEAVRARADMEEAGLHIRYTVVAEREQ